MGSGGLRLSNIEDELSCLAGSYKNLAARIRHITYDTTTCGERVEVRASYISFRDGEPTVDEFVQTIANFIVPFCLPRSEVRQASLACQGKQPNEQATIFSRLHQRAVDLFIRAKQGSSRSGELGEIALFVLIEWLLNAPQIVSKMYLKTSNNMPVHGTDGIHVRYDPDCDQLLVYWGESKAHKTLSGALSSALDSIKTFTEEGKEKREIEIVSAYLDVDQMTPESKEALLAFLDPYDEKSNQRVAIFACLLAFDFSYTATSIESGAMEAWFKKEFDKVAEKFVNTINGSLSSKGLGTKRFEFFLVPTPSVQELRDKFQGLIGWPGA